MLYVRRVRNRRIIIIPFHGRQFRLEIIPRRDVIVILIMAMESFNLCERNSNNSGDKKKNIFALIKDRGERVCSVCLNDERYRKEEGKQKISNEFPSFPLARRLPRAVLIESSKF